MRWVGWWLVMLSLGAWPQALVPEAISREYAGLKAAWQACNPEQVVSHYASDCTFLDNQGGQFDIARLRAQLQGMMAQLSRVDDHYEIHACLAQGQGYRVRLHVTRQLYPRQGDPGQLESEREDTWVKSASGWRIQRQQLISTSPVTPVTQPGNPGPGQGQPPSRPNPGQPTQPRPEQPAGPRPGQPGSTQKVQEPPAGPERGGPPGP